MDENEKPRPLWKCCGCGEILTLLPGEEDCCGRMVVRVDPAEVAR